MNAHVSFEGDRADAARVEDAVRGSLDLRDAILTSLGHPVPARPKKVRKAKAEKPILPFLSPTCCEKCGSPLHPMGRMISHIQAEVAAYYQIDPAEMKSHRQTWDVAHPRQVAMFLAADMTPKSLSEIARRFGGRDHTTIIHGIKAVKDRIQTDPEIAADVMVLREKLAA